MTPEAESSEGPDEATPSLSTSSTSPSAGPSIGERVTEKLRELLGLDLRALGLFRIGLGILLLTDLAIRASDLFAHYADGGVLPRDALIDLASRPTRFSLYLAVGHPALVGALFLLQAVFAFLFLVGFRTRLVTVVSWVLLISLHNRNPILLNAGDTVLRLLLFWSLFLPLGGRFSLDARRGERRRDNQFLSAATIALTAQICMVYVFTALLKTSPKWWDGTALFFALHADLFTTRFGLWVRELGWPLAPLTYASIYLEAFGVILLFVPFRTGVFRLLAIAAFIGLHVGILLCMNVGLFSHVCAVAWLVFLPGGFWKWIERRSVVGRLSEAGARILAPLVRFFDTVERRTGITAGAPCFRRTVLGGVVVALLFVYVVAWNIRTLDFDRYDRYFSPAWNPVAHTLRIDQKWSMFAPGPLTSDGWFVIEAELLNGDTVDLFRGGQPVSWEKPAFVLDEIPNRRWGKYLMRLREGKYRDHRRHYARYLTREWNKTHDYDHQLKDFQIYFMRETTTVDGPAKPKKITLWNHYKITPTKSPPRG